MRLLKNNLEQLAEAFNGFSQKPIDITFPLLPQDNRMRLVPKETENEKLIMYKDGDKMRIPGVLDYTGAKYPFKKLVKKSQEGDELPIVDPNAEIPEYMKNNPYYSDDPPSEDSLIHDEDVEYYYKHIIPEKLRKSRGKGDYSYIANIPFTNTAFFPDAYNYISDAYFSNPESNTVATTIPDFATNKAIVAVNPVLKNRMPKRDISGFLAHEYAHIMQFLNNLKLNNNMIHKSNGYTPEEIEKLKDAYDLSGYKAIINADEPAYEYDENLQLSEIGADNTAVGLKLMMLYKDKYNKYPTLSELNDFIDEVPKNVLIDMFTKKSSYGEYIFKGKKITDELINKIKKALKEVAMNNIYNEPVLYAKFGAKTKRLIRKGQTGIDGILLSNPYYSENPYVLWNSNYGVPTTESMVVPPFIEIPESLFSEMGIIPTDVNDVGEIYAPSQRVWILKNVNTDETGGYPGYDNPYDIILGKPANYSIAKKLPELLSIGNKKRNELKKKSERAFLSELSDGFLINIPDKDLDHYLNMSDWELYRTFSSSRNINHKPFKKIKDNGITDIIKSDIIPLLKKEFGDLLTEEDINEILQVYKYKNPRYEDPDKYFSKQSRNTNAYNALGKPDIIVNPWARLSNDQLQLTLIHELTHAIRLDIINKILRRKRGFWGKLLNLNVDETVYAYDPLDKKDYNTGYTQNEIKILSDAYTGFEGYKYGVKKVPIQEDHYPAIIEKGTTNAELREHLAEDFQKANGRRPTNSELFKYIDEVSDLTLFEYFLNQNGYSYHAYENYYGKLSPEELHEMGLKIRKALKTVGDNNLDNKLINDMPLMGRSGIKIKKKNRGKFTLYCGGNVTQLCINRAKNSGNKRLVKRAVFAENARKWNK